MMRCLLGGMLILTMAVTEAKGATVTIESGTVLIGETITVKCTTAESSMVVWYKKQGKHPPVVIGYKTAVSNKDFTSRVTITESQFNEEIVYTLSIEDATLQDSGAYSCDLIGASVETWHPVHVVIPIGKMELYTQRSYNNDLDNAILLYDGEDIIITDADRYFLACITQGSNPPPTFTITYGGQNITDLFTFLVEPTENPNTNINGLKEITHTVKAISNTFFEVPKEKNRQMFQCAASVPRAEEKSIAVRIIRESAPIVQCREPSPMAEVGQENVEFSCLVEAEPKPIIVFKFTSADGEEVDVSQESEKFLVQTTEKETGIWQVNLTILHIDESVFTEYSLNAANKHGNQTQVINLMKKEESEDVLGDTIENNKLKVMGSVAMVTTMVTITIISGHL